MSGRPLISRRSISCLYEALSDLHVLREIHTFFGVADVPLKDDYDSGLPGQRRRLTDSYVASLDLTDPHDVNKLLAVFADLLSRHAPEAMTPMVNALRADGFVWQDGALTPVNPAQGLRTLGNIVQQIDAHYIHNQVHRLHQSVEADPELAIGGAKELIESCCKTILTDCGVEKLDEMDVPKLVKETTKVLKLTPEDVPETARGRDAAKKLMGSLSTIAVSIAELRNEYGTGHGKHGRAKRPKPRHARLAVGCAATLATFLFETHELQKKVGSDPA